MKISITIVALIFYISCYSQRDKFSVRFFTGDSIPVKADLIIFPLTGDSVKIANEDLVAVIDINDPKHRVFYFLSNDWTSKIFRFDTNSTTGDIQNATFPDTIFYKEFEEKKICPICLKSKTLIHIVYGLPRPEEFKLAHKNKIRLGGCVYDFEKKYYCKKDDFEF